MTLRDPFASSATCVGREKKPCSASSIAQEDIPITVTLLEVTFEQARRRDVAADLQESP